MVSPFFTLLAFYVGASSALRKLEPNETCDATLVARQFDHKMEVALSCYLSDESVYDVIVDDSFVKEKFINGSHKSGTVEFDIPPSATINYETGTIIIKNKSDIVLRKKKDSRSHSKSTEKTVLVVRVVATNDATTGTQEFLSDSVFGTNGDVVNLKTQTNLCSHGELTYAAAPNRSSVDDVRNGITDGATTVSIDIATSAGDSAVRNAVTAELESQFGTYPSNLADHVMYCVPPNTIPFIAYAYVGGWNSVYSDAWCTYPSSQMHEIGHNLGLSHSGEGNDEYGNGSCMMGYSSSSDEGPQKCYGAPKAWELGWYPTKRVEVSASNGLSRYTGELAGYIEDVNDDNVPPMLVKIDIESSSIDYYLYFNRADGFMAGTGEGANRVMISEWNSNGYNDSYLQAELGSGDSWSIPGYPNGKVIVSSIGNRAVIDVYLYGSGPTASPTPCVGVNLDVKVITDNYPYETDWTLTDETLGTVLLEAPDDLSSSTVYEQSSCGTSGNCFKFTITDSFGDGICCGYGDGYYEIYAGGNIVAVGAEFDSIAEHEFCDNAPSCDDAFFPILFGEIDVSCNQIVSSNNCGIEQARSHCPNSCNACAEYGCEDTLLRFTANGGSYLCSDLSDLLPEDQIQEKCATSQELSQTCRGTCNVCNN